MASTAKSKAPAGEMQYAGFLIRFAAAFIDGLILIVINWILIMVTGGAIMNESGTPTANSTAQTLGQIAGIAYTVGFWGLKSTSPGKIALGLKIVDEAGQPITWVKAILRYVGYFVSSIVVGLGFFWIGWDPKKQGWHDKIAGTYVIKVKK